MASSLVPLGDIVDIKGGGTPSRNVSEYWGGEIPWATVKDLKGTTLSETEEYVTAEGVKNSASNIIPTGNIIIATRMALGKAAINTVDIAINQDLKALTCSDKIDARYLLHFLCSKSSFLESLGKGATVKGITLDVVKKLEIPLPPLPEQRRIAAILDKADAVRRKRQETIRLTEEFLRSVFLDMFGDPVTNPKGWEVGVLGEVVHSAKDGPHISPKYSEEGVPFLSTRHIKPGRIAWEDLKYLSQEEAEIQWKKCKPEKGDILYTKGGTTGIACAYNDGREVAVWVHVALLKTNHNKVDAVWLENMLNSQYCYQQSQGYTHGITNKDLGLKRMVKIQIYIPPLLEQKKFSRIVSKVKSWQEKMSFFYENNDELFNSIVQRAFRGNL